MQKLYLKVRKIATKNLISNKKVYVQSQQFTPSLLMALVIFSVSAAAEIIGNIINGWLNYYKSYLNLNKMPLGNQRLQESTQDLNQLL